MNKRELVKRLKKVGFEFERHGGNHDIYRRKKDIEMVPRHTEIDERLAKAILKKWNA
ncbi:MAG: type II toxin-antitoxin system HicA family toxin [Lentihominibacter sp.]|jgi:mRNA interferase HicA